MSPEHDQLVIEHLATLESKIKNLPEPTAAMVQSFSNSWTELEQDEELLIMLMNSAQGGPYPSPTTPGNIEYSWGLYFLNEKLSTYTSIGQWLYDFLKAVGMPDTKITASDWSTWWTVWNSSGVVMGDGSLVATQKMAVMDPGWFLAVLDYFLLLVHIESKATFNVTPNTVVVDPTTTPTLNIAVMGDWGSGDYPDGSSSHSPSYDVMSAIESLNPDMLLHLGDVYYAGTSSEEQNNLINSWRYNAPLGNFTLNSNHEMYNGGKSYFDVALPNALFAPYQTPNGGDPTSYFAIEYGNVVLLGLDSAYAAIEMFMQGEINQSEQLQFINQYAGKTVIVFTHHNPIDTYGETSNPLWDQVTGSTGLNGSPAMWYWGHIHNGIVYNDTSAAGTTLARCQGNGAIPIGNAPWLDHSTYVDYYTDTPLNDGDPNNANRVKNGFAILSITGSMVTETWYDQSGNQCWTNTANL